MNVEKEIDDRIHRRGGSYATWYVGVATNPREQLFAGHNVDEQGGEWLYREAGSESSARIIEAVFLKRGCKGGNGEGDQRAHYVYAYKMTRTTWGAKVG